MRLAFWFDKVSSSGDIKVKIARKIASLDKYLKHVSSDLREGLVKLSKGERFGYKVKVDLKIPGKEVIAESRSENLLEGVDRVVDKLRRGLMKRMSRVTQRARRR